jgi:hypothetical protein
MRKIHTRAKKKLGLGTHLSHRSRILNKSKKKGPKTFKTEEVAKKYAEDNNIKNFELKKVKKNKKFQIISS